jgi:hypothetical protein
MADDDSTDVPRYRYIGSRISPSLLEAVQRGNHLAIAEFAAMAARHLRDMERHYVAPNVDDVAAALGPILDAIAQGVEPNQAFKWTSKQPQNLDWLRWNQVQCIDELHEQGVRRDDARALVAKAAHISESRLADIEKDMKRSAVYGYPRRLFPVARGTSLKIQDFETRLEAVIAANKHLLPKGVDSVLFGDKLNRHRYEASRVSD